MRVSDHSLRQLDEGYLRTLKPEALQDLSVRLLADLKEARDRLGAGPSNCSRPPSSRPAWEKGVSPGRQTGLAAGIAQALGEVGPTELSMAEPAAEPESKAIEPLSASSGRSNSTDRGTTMARWAGKQPGAAGVGRTQVLSAQDRQDHRPEVCAGCGRVLALDLVAQAYSGFQSVDLC